MSYTIIIAQSILTDYVTMHFIKRKNAKDDL